MMRAPLLTLAFSIIISASLLSFFSAPLLAEPTEDERIAQINKENAEKGYNWTAGHTGVSGLSAEERHKMYGLLPDPASLKVQGPVFVAPAGMLFPSSFDWRAYGGTTPAKNQGQCGSCWDFAAVGQLESHIAIYDQRIEDLSEQQVLDCNAWSATCSGGWTVAAYQVFQNPGSVTELCYPYEGAEGLCRQNQCQPVAKIETYTGVASDVNSIKAAVMNVGPVTTIFRAEDNFSYYKEGCYETNSGNPPNHAMVIVGWDDNACAGQGAWIVKNSWGHAWGIEGYAYIKYGVCSIGQGAYQITYVPSTVFVNITAPNGGESWEINTLHQITWQRDRQLPDSINVLLSINGGVDYSYTIAHGLPGTATSFDWTVPNMPVNTARVKVVAYYQNKVGGYDASNNNFILKGPPYRYVLKNGNNVFPYSIPEWAARKIQDAVNAAAPGDTIRVAGEIYPNPVVADRAVYILGGWNNDFTVRDPAAYPTTIQCAGSCVSFMNITSGICGVEGFTLSYGTGTEALLPLLGGYGGGVFSYDSSPIIRHNKIADCGYVDMSNFSGGGGIACYGGSPLIEWNEITNPRAQTGGGIYLYQTAATIRHNRISGAAPDPNYKVNKFGGGIYALRSTATLEQNTIANNSGYIKGGGLYLSRSTATFSGDSISGNGCTNNGGGIFSDHSPLTIAHTVITENACGSATGGGIYMRAGGFAMANSIVARNSCGTLGGGMWIDSTWGAVENNTFDRNVSGYGGGNVYLGTMVNTSFRNNLLTYAFGSGFTGRNFNNLVFAYNGFFGNFPGDYDNLEPDSTNTIRHPHYADTTSSDYHLLVHSGGIDTGDPAGPVDPDGSRADLGAFGGPNAVMAAPAYVPYIDTAPGPDSASFYLVWGERLDAASYAVYSSAEVDFVPDATNFLQGVASPSCSLLISNPGLPQPRHYRVSAVNAVGHGGGYSSQLTFNFWDLNQPPTVSMIYPNGGEIFQAGDTVQIKWRASDDWSIDSVSVYYSRNGGVDYECIERACTADSTIDWIVPQVLSDSCLVKVVAYDPAKLTGFDASDSFFSLKYTTGIDDKGGGDQPPSYVTALEQNYPNPFNGTTTLSYTVASRCNVVISIYDPSGRLVRVAERAERDTGRYSVTWNGKDDGGRGVASGVYFCRITAGKFNQTRKIVYVR